MNCCFMSVSSHFCKQNAQVVKVWYISTFGQVWRDISWTFILVQGVLLGQKSPREKFSEAKIHWGNRKYDLFVVSQNGKIYNQEVAKTKKIHPRGFLKEIFTDFCSVRKIHQMWLKDFPWGEALRENILLNQRCDKFAMSTIGWRLVTWLANDDHCIRLWGKCTYPLYDIIGS